MLNLNSLMVTLNLTYRRIVLTVARRSPKPKVRVQILIPMPRASGEDGESHRTVNPALNRLVSSNLTSPTKKTYQFI